MISYLKILISGIVLFFVLFINNTFAQSVSFYVYDSPKGSVTSIINNTEDTINNYEYSAFGQKKIQCKVINNYRYRGEQFDSEIDLIFLRQRYYDPLIGRFITKDPLPGIFRNPQTKNPYPYCNNNPINFIDPTGENFEDICKWWLTESVVPGPYGQPMSEWENGEPTEWGDLLKYTEQAGGIWKWSERGAIGSAGVATAIAGGAMIYEAITGNAILVEGMQGTRILQIRPAGSNPWFRFDYGPVPRFGQQPHWHQLPDLAKHLPWDLFGLGILQSQGFSSLLNNNMPSSDGLFDLGGNISATPSWVQSNFGGVSLSKTAQLMLNIEDIAGAGYDEATGQVILYGRKNVSLPAMELDDLAVAVRSVYGYGGKSPQDPGVSIGTEPSDVPGQMKVRYDGQTNNTAFGSVMFESDRLLKCLTMGKDNITGAGVSSSVSGYKSML
ncbi:MAG: RHS repeat-associated core domain-containing protein, partial [Candidatus Omnitrophota bacterium]